jgi:hypothetical protein
LCSWNTGRLGRTASFQLSAESTAFPLMTGTLESESELKLKTEELTTDN